MKKLIALVAMVVSATAFAKGTVQVTDEGGSVSYVAPCWIQISNTTTVDGRRIAGFSNYDRDTVKVFTGTANTANAVFVSVDGGDTAKNAYIAGIQNQIKKCYQ